MIPINTNTIHKNNSDFLNRHIGNSNSDIEKMMESLNIKSLDNLINKVIPKNILSPINENLLEKDLSETNKNEETISYVDSLLTTGIDENKITQNMVDASLNTPMWYEKNND